MRGGVLWGLQKLTGGYDASIKETAHRIGWSDERERGASGGEGGEGEEQVVAAKKAAAKKPHGRPSTYTPAMGKEICDRMADGESVLKISKDKGMPTAPNIRRWVLGIGIPAQHAESFRLNYNEARQLQADHTFDDITEIADDSALAIDQIAMQAAKLRVDTRKWSLARMNRAKYGDQSQLTVGGDPDAPLKVKQTHVDLTNMTKEKLAQLRELAREAIGSKD